MGCRSTSVIKLQRWPFPAILQTLHGQVLGSDASVTCAASLLVGSWEAGMRRGVPSKSHSCSEMVEGHHKLIGAKMERDSPSSMERKIQEISFVLECNCDKANAMTDHPKLGSLIGYSFSGMISKWFQVVGDPYGLSLGLPQILFVSFR